MSQSNSPRNVARRQSRSKAGDDIVEDAKGPAGQTPDHVQPEAEGNKNVGYEPVYPPETLGPDQRPRKRRGKRPAADQRAGLIQKPPGT